MIAIGYWIVIIMEKHLTMNQFLALNKLQINQDKLKAICNYFLYKKLWWRLSFCI